MKSRAWMLESIFSLLVVLLVATSTVHAAPIRVHMGLRPTHRHENRPSWRVYDRASVER